MVTRMVVIVSFYKDVFHLIRKCFHSSNENRLRQSNCNPGVWIDSGRGLREICDHAVDGQRGGVAGGRVDVVRTSQRGWQGLRLVRHWTRKDFKNISLKIVIDKIQQLINKFWFVLESRGNLNVYSHFTSILKLVF